MEAIDRLGRTRIAVELGRAHLLYGEWLRRERRRMDARVELRVAHELFSDFGMEAFAERARVELEATGEPPANAPTRRGATLPPRDADRPSRARQALERGNRRAALYQQAHRRVPPRQVFAKLGINSRTKLARVLSPEPDSPHPLTPTTGFGIRLGKRKRDHPAMTEKLGV